MDDELKQHKYIVASNNKKVLEDKAKRFDGKTLLVIDKVITGKYPYTVRNIKTGEIRQYKYVMEV